MSQVEYSLSSCIYQKEFSFLSTCFLIDNICFTHQSPKSQGGHLPKEESWVFFTILFLLSLTLPFPTINLGTNIFFTFLPLEKGRSRWAELRGVSALPGTACTLTCNEDWVAPVQPLHVMHMKTQSEPLLPFPVGRRGVLGTSTTQWIFPCLTQFLVFSIYENFYLLRCLNFLSVYCSAFKKLFTSVLTTFSP